MVFLTYALLAAGLWVLGYGLLRWRERSALLFIGLAMIVSQTVRLVDDVRSASGSLFFALGACLGIVGSVMLILDVRRRASWLRRERNGQ
jgi:hypothetical protein